WVDICRNGRFLEPISNGFRTGLLGGDAPDYAKSCYFIFFNYLIIRGIFVSSSKKVTMKNN
ncbi:hypothetical protein, partial [Dysgonomonas sp. 521]|uniref:hypothetical protein n=1 Tax=Dysgonomonas sp. 521 TaxID=2302932 RepID=UPI001C889815